MNPVKKLITDAERALSHALGSALGPRLKPMTSGGVENKKDAEAVRVLMELRNYLGIKTELPPAVVVPEPKPLG